MKFAACEKLAAIHDQFDRRGAALALSALKLNAFGPEEAAKTDGLNANLWAGLAMVVVAAAFLIWTRLDPIRMVVRDNEDGAEEPHDISALD